MELNRQQALALLQKYNKEPFHIQHALTVEGVLRCMPSAVVKTQNSGVL